MPSDKSRDGSKIGSGYTTISLLKRTKAELDELLYSSGKKQSYDEFIKELVQLKKGVR